MGGWAFFILDTIGAVVWVWPLWLALIVVQVAFLLMGNHQHRWLPMGLMGVGFVWVWGGPVVTQLWEGWR